MIEQATKVRADKDNPPLVSVVLPVYNGEKFLAEAINSILAQTFPDFELILLNDGSTDGSLKILQEYEQLDPRVRLISRENRGLVSTLNESIDIARGEWIARMDQDDIALPQRLERQLEWIGSSGADIAGSWVQRFGTSDKRTVRLHQTDEAIKTEMLFCSPFAHPAVMMRRALVSQLRYDSAYEKAEDYDLWERAAEAGWKMTNIPEVLLMYRVHAAQISTRTANQQQVVEQEIRRRYWKFFFQFIEQSQKEIDKALKIFESPDNEVDMDAVDSSFEALFRHSHGESRKILLNHTTRLYYKMAASCPDIVLRWGKLNREFGEGKGAVTKIKLRLFRVLRMRPDGYLFKQLKNLYIRIS